MSGDGPDRSQKPKETGTETNRTLLSDTYPAALLALAVLVPPVAAVISIALYVTPWPRDVSWPNALAVPIAVAATGIAWGLGALAVRDQCTPQRADPGTYQTLLGRLETIEAQAGLPVGTLSRPPSSAPVLDAEVAVPDAGPPPLWTRDDSITVARRELKRGGRLVWQAFGQPGVPWVLASGYVQVWTLVHELEEALIELEPPEALIRDTLLDEARLTGSTMDDRDDLLEQLRLAVCQLGADAAHYIAKPPCRGPCPPPAPSPTDSPTTADPVSGATGDAASQARAILRSVRHAINEYRDTRRGGLVRARNQLMATVVVTGMTVYLLLALALVLRAPQRAIEGAAVFFLVGASVGLFNRLSAQSASDNAVDDFGLSTARLTLTPVFSGLAAIGGVLVTANLSAASQSLGAIFDVANLPFNSVVAAAFGLTPSLFLARIQQQSDKLKADLKNSQASSRGQ